MNNWINDNIRNKEIVISSRVRLARNIKDFCFPNKLDDVKGKELTGMLIDIFNSENEYNNFLSMKLWNSDEKILNSYLEKHCISSKLLKNINKAGLLINKDETVSIMINEEDHLRIQCITGGFKLKLAYEIANKIDDHFESKKTYAFDESLGYLTSSPTNLGTGMKASIIIHLPALTLNNEITKLLKGLTQVGMSIVGVYGEKSEAYGNIYQISNQVSLGITESEILSNLEAMAYEIMLQEKNARINLLKSNEYELKDRIFRSLGILKNAYLIDIKECMTLMSYVRLGVESSIIDNVDIVDLNKLLVEIQPNNIRQLQEDKDISAGEENFKRAMLIRERLNCN